MKKLLLVLVPLALFAQVKIDTVIRGLPSQYLGESFFIPELNKLYVIGVNQFLVLDCSTYQMKAQIPATTGLGHYSWNWRRQKLYIDCNPSPESTLVVDAAADSILGWLTVPDFMFTDAYLSDVDRLYVPGNETLYAFDCAGDTVAQRTLFPVPGHGTTTVSWDSVDSKLYVGGGARMGVYDYVADSFTKVMDVSSIPAHLRDAFVFNYSHHRGYLGPRQPEFSFAKVGIVDTELDTLLGVLPVSIGYGLYCQTAVDQRDGKVYIASTDGALATPDTLLIVDCATDSVLKKVEYEHSGYGALCVRWVPWSNRIYLSTDDWDSSHIVVLDCNTDSIIVPKLQLGHKVALDIQLDPVRERIFVIGADSGTIHVLCDTGYGIAEAKPSGPRPVAGLRLQMTSGGYEVRYSVPSPCRVDLSVYDLMGREVRRLVAEEQSAGQHCLVWNGTDRSGAEVARGVYFVRLDAAGSAEVKKAIVTR